MVAKGRHFNQHALADRAGLVSPSIDTLCMVCRALDIDMAELFRRILQDEPVRVHRGGERLTMEQHGVRYEQLMTSQTPRFPAEIFLLKSS